jgi:hypothetical protein
MVDFRCKLQTFSIVFSWAFGLLAFRNIFKATKNLVIKKHLTQGPREKTHRTNSFHDKELIKQPKIRKI